MTTPDALPPIESHGVVTSTNDLVLRAARHLAPHGTCAIAEQQLDGRGRRQSDGSKRAWYSPAHKNLYLSLLVKHALPMERASTLTLAAAVGAWRTLHPMLAEYESQGDELMVKWPNDLTFGSKKLGGILTEGVLVENRLDGVVIGVGLNINLASSEVPDELAAIATSAHIIAGESVQFDRLALAHTLRDEILEACALIEEKGVLAIVEILRPIDQTLGRRVSLQVQGATREGTSRGLAGSGGLIVDLDDGSTHEVQSGEVAFL